MDGLSVCILNQMLQAVLCGSCRMGLHVIVYLHVRYKKERACVVLCCRHSGCVFVIVRGEMQWDMSGQACRHKQHDYPVFSSVSYLTGVVWVRYA